MGWTVAILVSDWWYRAGLMAVNNKETLAITLALGPALLRTKVQQSSGLLWSIISSNQ